MEVPENLLYTQEHEWIRVDGNNAIDANLSILTGVN